MDGSKQANGYQTKDSGVRAEYESGMVRDTEAGKARFDLLFPEGVPYSAQMMTRFAELMARGAEKYEARNWEKARGQEELARYRSSAMRHLVQWLAGETDEDHAAAVMFNLMAGETVRWKQLNLPKLGRSPMEIVALASQRLLEQSERILYGGILGGVTNSSECECLSECRSCLKKTHTFACRPDCAGCATEWAERRCRFHPKGCAKAGYRRATDGTLEWRGSVPDWDVC